MGQSGARREWRLGGLGGGWGENGLSWGRGCEGGDEGTGLQESRAEGTGLGSDGLFREKGRGRLEDSAQGLHVPGWGPGRWVIPEMGGLGEKPAGVDGDLG